MSDESNRIMRHAQLFCARATYPDQISAIQRVGPVVMAINILVVVAVSSLFIADGLHANVLIWAGVGILLSVVGIVAAVKSRKTALTQQSVERAAHVLSLMAGFRAGHWAVGFFMLMPSASTNNQMALGWTLAGMLCGGNFAYGTLPRAAFAYLAVLYAGAIATFIVMGSPILGFLFVAITLYVCFLSVSTLINTQVLRSHIESEMQLKDQNEFMGIVLKDFEEGASDWLWEIGADYKITRGVERFRQSFGFKNSETQNQSLIAILQSRSTTAEQCESVAALQKVLSDAQPFSEVIVHFGDKENEVYCKFSAKPVAGSAGSWRGVVSNITETMVSQNRVNFLAFHDPLTGLPNRLFIKERLDLAVAEHHTLTIERWVMSVDLDGFKTVNDTYGHHTGDRLLVAVARRMQSVLKPSDSISRMGGDEFLLICTASAQHGAIENYAADLINVISQPYDVLGHKLVIGASIGIARVGLDGNTTTDILRHVDLALYRAKHEGRGIACVFNVSMGIEMQKKRILETDLRRAVVEGQFVLHYQPIVSVADTQICGYEALIRWQHPAQGLVPPLEFIPVAEETGLIVQIGEWVINEACKQAIKWPSHVRVSVNLSPLQIRSPKLLNTVVKALSDSGLRPGRLEMEVTESALLEQTDLVFTTLGNLKSLGVRIGLDDFGTGYSSLGYLHKFAFDNIKIDRSFVQAMASRPQSAAVVKAVLMLAEDLGISTTAEGIETVEQFNALKSRGCNEAQGYYFGRPMAISNDEVQTKLVG